MKHYCSIFLFLIVIFNLNAQVYTPIAFVDTGMVWNGYRTCGGMGQVWPLSWEYEVSGDTVIRNISYRKISSIYNTLGFFRKDSSEKVYYILSKDSLELEKSLYDFSLTIGDTLISGTDSFAVVNIDTVNFEGILRKRWFLNAYMAGSGGPGIHWGTIWIEGIGGLNPLGIFGYQKTLCYYGGHVETCDILLNGSTIYHSTDTQFGYCNTTGVNEILSAQIVNLVPNPANTRINISIRNSGVLSTIRIYNLLGELKSELAIKVPEEQLSMPIDFLSNGIYFLTFENSLGERQLVKFLKVD